MKTRRGRILAVLFGACCLLGADTAVAQPSQEEVLRSISENMDAQAGNPARMLALLCAAGALAIVLLVLSQRRKREVAPRPLHHQGKLLREMARSINLKPAELKQLKVLADQQGLDSPLTLLLCPSLLAKALREREGKVDRDTLSAMVKRLKGHPA